ncbi:Lrp/AsnC family transcriptional regulator [Kitasatospora sp. CM 4170]|uniref:AsnC family transcriptional regulator n=1 Tax=Kitasatospora aburaviensis TaxID=67265 RepID=A0ABW1F310_9ACTN|nr:Lrp/AsnC family transcriptional regulator [Kitasatospora sp. CM 4170]WNM45545.1 Lrp/AsnC family transcriptional regulator [Kitasatospora sp. CM 4170]
MDLSAADPDTVLDLLDRRLVCALQVDGRAGTGRIAEVLGVSTRTVTRRLTRLQQSGLLRVVRMPDVEDAAVGALLLRVRVLRGKVDTIARALADRSDVPFVDVMLGGQEVGAVVLSDACSRDRLLYGQLPATAAVTETTAHAVLHAYADAGQWRAGYLDEAEAAALAPPSVPRPAAGETPLDALDRALLARLGEDARQSHAALAAAVGAPESTVRRRLDRLAEGGLLRTHTTIDPPLLGMAVDANLWLDVPPGRLAEVGTALAGHPQVHGVFATSGPANLMATVFCADHGGLYRFVTGTLGPLGITRAETVIVGRAVKRAGVVLNAAGPANAASRRGRRAAAS